MRVSTLHERVQKQLFEFTESDVENALRAYAAATRLWSRKPDDATERIEIEVDGEEPERMAILRRVFTYPDAERPSCDDVKQNKRSSGEGAQEPQDCRE